MATPLTEHWDGGVVSVMAGPVNPIDPSPTKSSFKISALKSPILIVLFFHKAIRSELDRLHRAAVAFATDSGGDIGSTVIGHIYHLDLCKNVFGEGIYPDVDGTNLYDGGTKIVGTSTDFSYSKFTCVSVSYSELQPHRSSNSQALLNAFLESILIQILAKPP